MMRLSRTRSTAAAVSTTGTPEAATSARTAKVPGSRPRATATSTRMRTSRQLSVAHWVSSSSSTWAP